MRLTQLVYAAALAGLLVPSLVFGVDGVILIDQNKALAGNVTLGDTPGFPVSITQSGSYRLDSNLLAPAGANGIEITASNVTIDLNGFSIIGTPGDPDSPPFIMGILFRPVSTVLGPLSRSSAITIRNGSITGFIFPLLPFLETGALPTMWTLQDLVLSSSVAGAAGLGFGDYARISHVTAVNIDLIVSCPSLVTDTVAQSISQDFSLAFPPGSRACTFVNNATLQ
jgi:hypothetical protein